MEPLFFGSATAQLYGVHHRPAARPRRDVGVLLCYPSVHEYNRSHWAFRKLASLLSRQGVHVLRFDYSGTGDSAGDLAQASVERWCADIREAAAELSALARVAGISIVGFRLGAALAAMASADLEVRDLVLWEPAIDGREHLRELRRIDRWKRGVTTNAPRVGRSETLGYAWSPELRAGIEALRPEAVAACRAERVLIFAGEERPAHRRLASVLGARPDGDVRYQIVPETASDRLDGVLLSTRIQQAIAEEVAGRAA